MAEAPSLKSEVDSDAAAAEASRDKLNATPVRASPDQVRWFLAKYVVWLYVGIVSATALYFIYRGLFCGENVAVQLFDLIKIAVLPIVTFVIGYYYGSATK